ncbi:MAG TPA: M48 family metallopeptidase [Candidatus Pacearchaeota archaeon]|nr:M48 family metallopeptidase [Candidatus Pacearchaeota archaeon]
MKKGLENSRIDFRDQIARNKIKSYILMFFVFATLIALGYAISFAFEPGFFFIIMIFSIIFSLGYLLVSYYNSDKIALATVNAKKADKTFHKQYYDLVESLTLASGVPMPSLYVMNSSQINAFASGRDPKHSVICVTEGALEKLDKKELEGVLAHELAHIESYDIRYMTLVAVMVGMISIISEMFLRSLWYRGSTGSSGNSNDRSDNGKGIFILIGIILAIIAPIIVQLVQFAISRKREYSADASAVKFTRYPNGLIQALEKIQQDDAPTKKVNKAIAPLFFASPLRNLTSTHPPIAERIKVLQRM